MNKRNKLLLGTYSVQMLRRVLRFRRLVELNAPIPIMVSELWMIHDSLLRSVDTIRKEHLEEILNLTKEYKRGNLMDRFNDYCEEDIPDDFSKEMITDEDIEMVTESNLNQMKEHLEGIYTRNYQNDSH